MIKSHGQVRNLNGELEKQLEKLSIFWGEKNP